jgi:outer membrane protein assembly factor BamB
MDFSKAGGSNKVRTWEYFLQEMDKNKKVVRNWKTFDYFKPSDIISVYDLKAGALEHGVNCNAIWQYPDGNILLCSRKLDEITKIDWKTGKILWRMGGVQSKNNQFKFINDPKNGFSHQHTASVLENGNILLMDNGNFNKKGVTKEDIFFVPETRIIEYKIDESAKTAELVWEYKIDGMFVPIMGSAQRLNNGNTLMCWAKDSPAFTEVDSQGNKVWEMDLPKGFQCYSAYKFK